MPGIDLHAHTTASDGTLSPSEVVALAHERGLDVVAITDHDTTRGLDEAASAGDRIGVRVIPGVEFSAEYEGYSVHVLAYWPDPGDADLQDELKRLEDTRLRRGELMVEKLREMGHPIEFEQVRRIAQGPIVRPHVAQAMVEAGIVPDEKAAFTEEFIADGGRAWVAKHALHPLDAVRLIRRAGGVCVLAHPGMWKDQSSVPEELIEAMAAGGMVGLEVDHPDHDDAQRARYRDVAGRLGLAVTGASDCHGARYDPIRLGCETTAPEQLEALRAAAGRS